MMIWTCEACDHTACEVCSDERTKAPQHCPFNLIPRFHAQKEVRE